MARQPVPRPPPGNDWALFNVRDPSHRAALLQADADDLWRGGFVVLAQALDELVEFRHAEPTLTARQVAEARALRQRLGLPGDA